MKKNLRTLFITTEITPIAKVGGLADFSGSFTKAMKLLGVDIRVFLPLYSSFISHIGKKNKIAQFEIKGQDKILPVDIFESETKEGLKIYLVSNPELFEKRANIYGYFDDPLRWYFFCLACLEFLKQKIFLPDLIHANDWPTGYLANLLFYETDIKIKKIARLFTIHNLEVQGAVSEKYVSELQRDPGRGKLPAYDSPEVYKINVLKRGLIYSDIISTVSETYAKEILTPEYGMGLEKLLYELKDKLFGVVNGLDPDFFNPKTDKYIYYPYSLTSIDKKIKNKICLQKELGLRVNKDIPLLGFVGRLIPQKGVELIIKTVENLAPLIDFQFVFVGSGETHYEQAFYRLTKKYPKRIDGLLFNSKVMARKIYAASDIFLYPSFFEPCGLAQLIAMHYGSIPVVRKTGGLIDTVEEVNVLKNKGTGFFFENFKTTDFLVALVRAMTLYLNKSLWRKIVKRAMTKDFSWRASAKKYLELYKKAIKSHGN